MKRNFKISDITPDPCNANKGTERGRSLLERSLRNLGAGRSILVDKNNVAIAGNKTLEVAAELNLRVKEIETDGNELIVVRRTDLDLLTDKKAKELAVADNRVSEIGLAWDGPALAAQGIDLAPWFNTAELSKIGAGSSDVGQDGPDPQLDKAEALRKHYGVELGQVWELGEHRLMCGDSTQGEDVGRLMDGEKAGLCFTSPPYSQQRDYKKKITDWDALMQGVFDKLPMAHDGQVLVNLGLIHRDSEWNTYWDEWVEWMRAQGWRRFGWYVWDQGPGLPGDWNGRFAPSFEFVFHFNRASVEPIKWVDKKPDSIQFNDHGNGMRRSDGTMSGVSSPELSYQPTKIPDSVIRVVRHKARGIEVSHPAVFAVGLPEYVIKSWGGVAYDPFLGSGTTLIACEHLGRRCYAMEISPAYTAVAIQRWVDLTGKAPRCQ